MTTPLTLRLQVTTADRRHLALAALAGLTGLLAGLLAGTTADALTSTAHGLAVGATVALVVLARGAARRHLDGVAGSAPVGAGVLAPAQRPGPLDVAGHPCQRPAA